MLDTARIADFDDPDFNPFVVTEQVAGQGQVQDVYSELRRLRQQGPVLELDPRLHFGTQTDGTVADRRKITVLGHDEITTVQGNPALFISGDLKVNLGAMFGATITAMDGDEHRRYRALFQKAFAPTMLDEWKSVTVPRIVNTLIDKFESRGRADLVSEFALHFPFQFITELLALPVEDRPIFHKLAFAQTTVRYDPAHAGEAGEKLTSYLRELIAERLVDPPDPSDFIHTLAVAEIDGERLPEIVLISFLRQLMNAAGDTSYHGFSNLAAALLTHPDQLAAVRANRALIPQAVEEALRWEPPIVFIERSPSETTSLGGIELHPGDRMYIGIGAYNRDEAVFERPDEFDIYRPKQRHLVFGQGPHICIGQHLARAEMIVALNALLDRLPHLRIDPEAAYPHVYGVTLRKPKRVDVVFN